MEDGSVFAGLDPDYDEWKLKLFRRTNKKDPTPEKLAEGLEVWDILPESSCHSVLSYRELMVEHPAKCTIQGHLVADVSQSHERLRSGHFVPTLQCNSQMVLLRGPAEAKAHVYTPKEMLTAMGHPAIESVAGKSVWKHARSFNLSSAGIKWRGVFMRSQI